jgi:type II pantothenate kinase
MGSAECFKADAIDECVRFIQELIECSASINGIQIEEIRQGVKIMVNRGGVN